jgi:hypothetical protein
MAASGEDQRSQQDWGYDRSSMRGGTDEHDTYMGGLKRRPWTQFVSHRGITAIYACPRHGS